MPFTLEVTSDDIAASYLDPSRCPLERAFQRKFDIRFYVGYDVYGYNEFEFPIPKAAAKFAKDFDATTLDMEATVKPKVFEFNETILP